MVHCEHLHRINSVFGRNRVTSIFSSQEYLYLQLSLHLVDHVPGIHAAQHPQPPIIDAPHPIRYAGVHSFQRPGSDG